MDLFATHLNHQLALWFNLTGHLLVVASETLSQPCTALSRYGFPPIPFLEKTLVKIRKDQADKVIVITLS